MLGCPYLYDKIEAFDAQTALQYDNGRNFQVRFVGINKKPGYLTILSDAVNPLKGGGLTLLNKTIIPYSTNLFYSPIPYEMLYTFEQQP